jgi:hypothetical protein
LDRVVDDSINSRLGMQSTPLCKIETRFLLFDADWVAGKKIGYKD